jgi:hypothetical protein
MRLVDPYDEANYLGLPCARLGNPAIGRAALAALAAAGIPAPSSGLLAAYGGFRCVTRARLSLDRLRERHPQRPDRWPVDARACLADATLFLDAVGD